ncbi:MULTISPECIES: alpha/beta hydrolase [Jonquetella]|uniref:Serine aminopeptidase S33 domain-containing protein n=1 Tax=Jonquetella anthropi DSM 22815 TaxID=885272 RepID=H0UJP4_9BACT|nr:MULTISPECIES: alpha/beta hydrolase [Jonquetella]EHM13942.1 hypothetical protein JonanDRAFT_1583 [Jonquetella anthropi DSM 22815]ERL24172.1 alpha/beta hydrolase family protein [Jonquetella sp. BV3C21]
MRWKSVDLAGSYGDRITRLSVGVVNRPRRAVVLFHGVHSWAQPLPGNKYASLGGMLAERGVLPVLVESSRSCRDRLSWGSDLMGWIKAAFGGKTFEQEFSDASAAVSAVASAYPRLPLTLWGFSLGGLIALLAAGGYGSSERVPVDGLIVSGSGDQLRPECRDALALPILRDLPDRSFLEKAARNARPAWFRSFYGSLDASFDQPSCRRLYEGVVCDDKKWFVVDGADHSFRTLNGSPSRLPLQIMVRELREVLLSTKN